MGKTTNQIYIYMFFIIVAIGCSIFLSFLLLYVPGPAPNPPNIQPVSRGAGVVCSKKNCIGSIAGWCMGSKIAAEISCRCRLGM